MFGQLFVRLSLGTSVHMRRLCTYRTTAQSGTASGRCSRLRNVRQRLSCADIRRAASEQSTGARCAACHSRSWRAARERCGSFDLLVLPYRRHYPYKFSSKMSEHDRFMERQRHWREEFLRVDRMRKEHPLCAAKYEKCMGACLMRPNVIRCRSECFRLFVEECVANERAASRND